MALGPFKPPVLFGTLHMFSFFPFLCFFLLGNHSLVNFSLDSINFMGTSCLVLSDFIIQVERRDLIQTSKCTKHTKHNFTL